jgi:hypothetical protein
MKLKAKRVQSANDQKTSKNQNDLTVMRKLISNFQMLEPTQQQQLLKILQTQ